MRILIESAADNLWTVDQRAESKVSLRSIPACPCRESIPASNVEILKRLKYITVFQFKYQSAMGGYSGVMGQPWGVLEVFYRYKWEKGEWGWSSY